MIEIANGDASRQGKDDWFHVTIVISNSERFPNGQSSSENASLVHASMHGVEFGATELNALFTIQ